MLAEIQTASHGTICELKLRLQNFDYKIYGGLSIKIGHAAYRMVITGQILPEMLNNSHRVVSEPKLSAFLWGFLKAFCSTSHCISSGQYLLILVCKEITGRILNELFINWLFINCITMHIHQLLMRGSCL